MTRTEFKTIIKIFSAWKIDKRRGNYLLPSGVRLKEYLRNLTEQLLKRNELAIKKDGSVGELYDGKIFVPFGEDEIVEQQEQRIRAIVDELVY